MRILADTNVPEEYVAALRGDGHDVLYSRRIPELGPVATDDTITDYAERGGWAVLSTDQGVIEQFTRWLISGLLEMDHLLSMQAELPL